MSAQISTITAGRMNALAFGVAALVILSASCLSFADAPVALASTAPSNDNLANATVLTGSTGTTAGDNTSATLELFEPPHYADRAGQAASVWFKWTAPSTGYVTFATDGGFDSVMAAYEQIGSGFSGLRKKAENDDDPLGGVGSRITFPATTGKTYYVAVAGWYWTPGYYGPFVLSWNMPSPPPTGTAPVAEAAGDYTMLAGQSLSLDASASLRADGGSKDTFTYNWSLDGVNTVSTEASVTLPWSTIVESTPHEGTLHTDPASGLPAYTIYLKVQNGADTRADTAVLRIYTLDDRFALRYGHDANGSVEGSSTQMVSYGSSGSEVTATPAAHYHFVNWSDGSTANPRIDANINGNLDVAANFEIDTFTLNYAAGSHGAIGGTASQTVNYNTSGTAVTALPEDGYHFVKWSDESTANPRIDSAVKGNVDVTANFAAGAFNPVWRFRNRSGYYLWSANAGEKDNIVNTMKSTWTLEGVAYTINPLTNTDTLWRFRNNRGGFYLYTANSGEKNNILNTMKATWTLEGPAYTVSNDPAGNPVWRFRNLKNGTYLLTGVQSEKDNIVNTMKSTWILEGPAFYIAP